MGPSVPSPPPASPEIAGPAHGPRALLREIVKFGAVGGLGLAVNFAVFNVCRAVAPLPVMWCSVVATGVAIVSNYLGFRYFTYRDRDKRGPTREFALFVALSLVSLVIENGVLFVAMYWFGWDTAWRDNLMKALGIAAATCFRFFSYRTWVFRPPATVRNGSGPAARQSLAENREP